MKGNPAAQHAIALVKVKLNEEKHPDAELLQFTLECSI